MRDAENDRDRNGSAHRSSRRRTARGAWAWIKAQFYIEHMETEDRLAPELDLPETAVRHWLRRAEVEAGRSPAGALTTAEREGFAQLR